MKLRIVNMTIFCTLLLTTSVAWAARDGELRLRFQIFSISGSMAEEDLHRGNFWTGSREDWEKKRDELTLIERGRFRIGQDALSISEKGCFWNGMQLFMGEKPSVVLPANKIRWIPAPDTYLEREEKTTVRIESRQAFEYLTRRPDGLLEQHQLELPTGIVIEARPRKSDRHVEFKDLMISVQAVERREPVEGSSLLIGKPVLTTVEHKLPLRLERRRPYGVLLRAGGGHGAILICLDVTDIPQAVWSAIRREFPEARVEAVDWENDNAAYDIDGQGTDGRAIGLKIAADGSINSKSIEARLPDLAEPVRQTIARELTGAQVGVIMKTISPEQTFYRVQFKRNRQFAELRVGENGQILNQ